MTYKYGIGPMSKNIVDECINYANQYDKNIIIIPSRRQVDYNSGYVNNWTTETLSTYIKSKTSKILIKRDHGGPLQGAIPDDGLLSLKHDCLFFDAIHIDPWKSVDVFFDGCVKTRELIEYCYNINKKTIYEVGTEESIFRYTDAQLHELLTYLSDTLPVEILNHIKFAVIQSGTSLKESKNTGSYDKDRLCKMISVCNKFKMISKEHNGDYLPMFLINEKFRCGLNTINIAPEFGQIETRTYLTEVRNTHLFNIFFDICYASKK
jgi:hypothetical protein